MYFRGFQEQVFFAVTRILIPMGAGDGESTGTGFIVEVPVKNERSLFLLVSNKHVYDSNMPFILSFHKKKEGGRPSLEENYTLTVSNYSEQIYRHPDDNVDLAALNISSLFLKNLYVRAINQTMLSDFSNERLLPGEEIWFVGYPEGLFDKKHNLPILRRGYISTVPKVDFGGRKVFMIDAHVHCGSSGSPVFWNYKGKFELLGVVSETMMRRQNIKTDLIGMSGSVSQALGLGVVIKSICVKELIDSTLKQLELDTDDG